MTVSIIIAVKTWQKNLEECVRRCQGLDFSDFEILILPDSGTGTVLNRHGDGSLREPSPIQGLIPTKGTVPVQIIPTGPVSPAQKRDIAMNNAKSEILAFIDDDAYPDKEWLKQAIENFKDPEVAAVGGPAITPDSDSLRQKASGAIYASLLVSGNYRYRYLTGKKKEVDDYPSCNFFVRKSIMQELGGFQTNFWPGEDTKLCLDITKKLGKKIIYDPTVLVYHHRRPVFAPHLKQIISYALHRGYFVKRYPQTSLKISYFLPSIFVIGILSMGIISLFSSTIRSAYLAGVYLYLFFVLIFSISMELRLMPFIFIGTILTHFAYGIYFLKGLFANKLREE